MCAKGQSHIEKSGTNDNFDVSQRLIGPRCESILDICNMPARCLLDTGSQDSTVSYSFFQNHLQDFVTLQTIDQIINIEVAVGFELPYKGFIEAEFRFHKTVTGSSKLINMVFLVVEDTKFNSEVPILFGTNVLKYCLQLCKENLQGKYGSFNLRKCRASRPWRLAYRCLATQIVNNHNEVVQLCNSDSTKVCSSSESLIDCHVNGNFGFSGSHMLLSSNAKNLPG